MMYPFLQLDDETEIVHSEILYGNNENLVKVYFEKPIEGGFQSATCYLPNYQWEKIEGFSETDIERFTEILETTAHLILRFAGQGGFANASNF